MPKEYSQANEVKEIAEKLIQILKPELEGFEIRYIFCNENPKKDGREVIALASKVIGRNAFLSGSPDGYFLMEVGLPAWESLTVNQKIAVVHHELCHYGINELGNLEIIPHEIEEFVEVANVHGAYFDRLQVFADAVEAGNSDTRTRDEIINEIISR